MNIIIKFQCEYRTSSVTAKKKKSYDVCIYRY